MRPTRNIDDFPPAPIGPGGCEGRTGPGLNRPWGLRGLNRPFESRSVAQAGDWPFCVVRAQSTRSASQPGACLMLLLGRSKIGRVLLKIGDLLAWQRAVSCAKKPSRAYRAPPPPSFFPRVLPLCESAARAECMRAAPPRWRGTRPRCVPRRHGVARASRQTALDFVLEGRRGHAGDPPH